jgi:uncharacterized protein
MARLRLPISILACLLLVALVGFHAAGAAPAAPAFPALTGRIVDQASLLDAAMKARIDGKLAELERKTTTQLVVVTLPSLQDHDIADYGYQLGRHWGIGQRGSNNGVLLIVAPNERKVRIEVGYGLEGTLTDAVTRLIIANAILPRFRTGDFAGGIERGVDDLVLALSGGADDFKQRAAEQDSKPTTAVDFGTAAFVGLILIVWLIIFLRKSRSQYRRGRSRSAGWWGAGAGGWSSGSSSGSSWGGSSGGGFSGGGGSFGGGGSSGSW